jgi:ABC-type lipoprotein release transport system permease subunit
MKSIFLSLILFLIKAGTIIGILLGLLSLAWIVYAETYAPPAQALNGISTPLGHVWFSLHTYSLNISQSLTQRYLSPKLWEVIIVPLLVQPIWIFCLLTLGGNIFGLFIASLLSRRLKS